MSPHLPRLSAALALSLAAVALPACRGGEPVESEGEVVALVNGQPIHAAEISRDLARVRREAGSLAFRSEEELARVRRDFLDKHVDERLLLQEARRRQISVADDEVERALLRLRADYPGRTFEELIAEEGIPLSRLKREIRDRLTIQVLVAQEVNARVAVTDTDVDHWYESHPEAFERPEEVRALQIVVKTEEEASRLLRELKKGADFADLARRHSIAPEATDGGSLGWFPRGVMPAPIEETCFALGEGRLSDVVESPYGYHLFKVVDRRKAEKRPLDDALRREIERRLRREKEEAAQDLWVLGLREAAQVDVREDVLAEVR